MSDDRKYRQRGYQERDGRGESGGRAAAPSPPREKREGPRGRGLGAPAQEVFRCAACGERRAVAEVTAEATCMRCGAALQACSNCAHFDTGSRWECRRSAEIPARIASKRAANSCPVFTPRIAQEFGKDSDRPGDARSAFDALFKL